MGVWYNQIGFYNNPFSIKPASFHNEILGNDDCIGAIIDKIKSGSVVFIEGDYGMGKTTMLRKIIKEFGGKKRLIYYSCNRKEGDLNTDDLLKDSVGFFAKLFGLKVNDPILLLDEAQDLSEQDLNVIAEKFNSGVFKSIIMVSKDYKKMETNESFKKLFDKNVVKLKPLNENDAIGFIRRRIGNIKLLSDDTIKKIYKKSNNNPREFLKNCEEICRYTLENYEDVVTEEHLKKFF